MENKINSQLTPEQKEKKDIEFENKILSIVLPSAGIAAFVIGLLGFIAAIGTAEGVGPAIFLLILALLGAGGIAYGVLVFLKLRRKKYFKEESVPSDEPNAN